MTGPEREPDVDAVTETANGPISVTGADPSEGEQGETLEVRIHGEGFGDEAVPAWERDGVIDTTIVVDQVVFVSTIELRATITIAANSPLGLRDIAVFRNKKGIGSEDRGVGEDLFVVNEYTPQPMGFVAMALSGGVSSFAAGINEAGEIAGTNYAAGRQLVLYWQADTVVVVDELGAASGINNRGWIVGWVARDGRSVPFIFEERELTLLEGPDGARGSARAINDAGTIVGGALGKPIVWHRDANGEYGKAVYLPELAVQVGELAWEGGAGAVNARGDVVGTLSRSPAPFVSERVPVLWRARPDGKTYEDPLVLGGGVPAGASGINDAGWIVGSIGGGPGQVPGRAVLWHPDDYSQFISLSDERPSVETFASAVNNRGQIIGTLARDGYWESGRLWTVGEAGQTISTRGLPPLPGFQGARAAAINDAGWIVGESVRVYPVGYVPPPGPSIGFHATLWRPDM